MDKNSTDYFMTKMTQEEFSEIIKDHKNGKIEFNRIQPERLNPEDHIVEPNKMVCDSLNSMET